MKQQLDKFEKVTTMSMDISLFSIHDDESIKGRSGTTFKHTEEKDVEDKAYDSEQGGSIVVVKFNIVR